MNNNSEKYLEFKKFITDWGEIFKVSPQNWLKEDLPYYEELEQMLKKSEYYSDNKYDFDNFINIIYESELIDSKGGSEEGSHYERTYSFPNAFMYITFIGYYISYEGVTYENMQETEPVQVTYTEYKNINRIK